MTTPSEWSKFGEKVRLAVESSLETHYERGLSGLELELNILDGDLRPVTTVGYGPGRRSFAEYLLEEHMADWAKTRCQLEVFHWMVEVATRPYYDLQGTAFEGRLLEASIQNALSSAGLAFGESFSVLHGNLLFPVHPSKESIPDGWALAKKKYLSRCVDLFGDKLATAGIHTNHSYPEALLSWDFFHLPRHDREGRSLVDYRNEVLMRATRLLRAFCPIFIAVSASTPLAWEVVNGEVAVVVTERDSNRLLTFPNPPQLDVPHLYASHDDYLKISYDLVRRGTRFGANNWTPVRARSDVDPVNRNIWTTSEQLAELYRKGLYRAGEDDNPDGAEKALMVENLCARVDLPMTRVEVRTDEGGDTLALSAAKLAFKEALMLRIYADPSFGEGYTYDGEDVARARRNERATAKDGLDAVMEHPFHPGTLPVRAFLRETLEDMAPLVDVLSYGEVLAPLREMARGGPNPAGECRAWFEKELRGGEKAASGRLVVCEEALKRWSAARLDLLRRELAAAVTPSLGEEEAKLAEAVEGMSKEGARDPSLPIRIAEEREGSGPWTCQEDRLSEVLALSRRLCSIPSVTNCSRERLDEVARCARFIAGWLKEAGAEVRLFEGAKYPAVVAGFPGRLCAPVVLGGHFDVVEPDPNDTQFQTRIEGEYLWGRGTADMKTVVASDMVWMRRTILQGPPYPPFSLLFVGNEENGEAEAFGTPHLLRELERTSAWSPGLMIFGERTGERGNETVGKICLKNRGVVRVQVTAKGERAHTGMAGVPKDLSEALIDARVAISGLMEKMLTREAGDGWVSGTRFPFFSCGEPGVYNITPEEAVLGVEVRPIPEDDLDGFLKALGAVCAERGLAVIPQVLDKGIACPEDNPYLAPLLAAAGEVRGDRAETGGKLAGTSARFAPGGNAAVWGQTGIGPHARGERHFIPSIEPYMTILDAFAARLAEPSPGPSPEKEG